MAPDPLNDVVMRCLAANPPVPDAADVLRLYLELPRIVLQSDPDSPMHSPVKVRSSFEAVFADATTVANANAVWLATVGFLIFLDQVGTVIERTDMTASSAQSVERALEQFATEVDQTSRTAIYALRCSLVHDFSLVNPAEGVSKPVRKAALRHAFRLQQEASSPLVTFPSQPWDGDWQSVTDTVVDLGTLRTTVTDVHTRILDLHDQGFVQLCLDPAETRRRYFFVHPVGVDEWNAQDAKDSS